MGDSNTSIKMVTLISYLVMAIICTLANFFPIKDMTIIQIGAIYPSLIKPADYAYSIFGLIIILLLGFALYQLFPKSEASYKSDALQKIRIYFIISSIAYTAWVFAWICNFMALSLMLIIINLLSIIMINIIMGTEEFSIKEKTLIRLPFSMNYAWVTFMTFINVTSLLVSIGWKGLGIPQSIWTIITMSLLFFICLCNLLKFKDFIYGLTMIWAYIGILVKHASKSGLSGQYPEIIVAASIIIILILATGGYLLLQYKRKRKYELYYRKDIR